MASLNSVFKLYWLFFSCGYSSEEIIFNGKILRAFLWLVPHLLEVAYGRLQLLLGVDTSQSFSCRFRSQALIVYISGAIVLPTTRSCLQHIGVRVYPNSFPEGCLRPGHSWLNLNAVLSRATWQLCLDVVGRGGSVTCGQNVPFTIRHSKFERLGEQVVDVLVSNLSHPEARRSFAFVLPVATHQRQLCFGTFLKSV